MAGQTTTLSFWTGLFEVDGNFTYGILNKHQFLLMFICDSRYGEVCSGKVYGPLTKYPWTEARASHSEDESAGDFLYQILSYFSQCIFPKMGNIPLNPL